MSKQKLNGTEIPGLLVDQCGLCPPERMGRDGVNKGTISRGFKNARTLSGLSWDNPPSFHEIRSLSGRLYKDQGVDAQSLLGYKSAETTALYIDVRGSEWISVE